MKVTLDIDDKDFWLLANRAERQGVKVADLLVGMIRAGRGLGKARPVVFRDRVAELVAAGIPDPVIAHRLGEPIGAVGVARRSIGLKPVRFVRSEWEHEFTRPATRSTVDA